MYLSNTIFQARTLIGKSNRSKLVTPHTAGSKSFARVAHEWSKVLGYNPRRDELFVKTHTSKDGVPTNSFVAASIKQLEEVATKHPELKEKTIKEGDLFSRVFGRDPRDHVRSVGLGPTPPTLGMPGHRKYTPTRVQMAIRGRRKAEEEVTVLKGTVNQLREEMEELRQLVYGSYGRTEATPEYGSNPTPHVATRVNDDHNDDDSYERYNDNSDHDSYQDESNYSYGREILERRARVLPRRHEEVLETRAPVLPRRHEEVLKRRGPVLPRRHEDVLERRGPVLHKRHEEGGKEVTLLSIERPFGQPVALATIQTTDPKAQVGGAVLGNQFCEVVVNFVMKRNGLLPRPYGNIKTMVDALGKSIAWPVKNLRETAGPSKDLSDMCIDHLS